MPPLDDELVAKSTEFESTEEFRAKLEADTLHRKVHDFDNSWRGAAAEQLAGLIDGEDEINHVVVRDTMSASACLDVHIHRVPTSQAIVNIY